MSQKKFISSLIMLENYSYEDIYFYYVSILANGHAGTRLFITESLKAMLA